MRPRLTQAVGGQLLLGWWTDARLREMHAGCRLSCALPRWLAGMDLPRRRPSLPDEQLGPFLKSRGSAGRGVSFALSLLRRLHACMRQKLKRVPDYRNGLACMHAYE